MDVDTAEAIFSTATQGIVVLHEDQVTHYNDAARNIFQFEPEEVMGSQWIQRVVPEEYRDEVHEIIRQKKTCRFETKRFRKDGQLIDVEMSFSFRGPIGIAFVRDITAQKRALQEQSAAREKSDTENQLKSQFLATMSHEIRTPLGSMPVVLEHRLTCDLVILSLAELLEDTELNREQRENLSLLRMSGNVLLNLINDILDFSKIAAGKLVFERINFDVRNATVWIYMSLIITTLG